jgi:tetratricopeptide (TPR) repeat protein
VRQNGDAPSWQDDLRTALRHLWDPDRLSQSPLAELGVVQQRIAGREGTLPAPLDRAQALRQVLTEALESLRPPGSPPSGPHDRRWQRYRLLRDTYWQGQDNETVSRQLYLSRTTFYREQGRAIAALAQADALLEAGQAGPLARQLAGFPSEPGDWSLAEWVAVRLALGRALAQPGDHDGALAALATYDHLLVVLQAPEDAEARRYRAEVYDGLAAVYEQQDDYEAALVLLQQGIAQVEGLADELGLWGRLLAHTAGVLCRQAQYESAIAYAETALWASRRAGDRASQIRAHQDLAGYYAQRGDCEAGEHAMQVRLLRGRAANARL